MNCRILIPAIMLSIVALLTSSSRADVYRVMGEGDTGTASPQSYISNYDTLPDLYGANATPNATNFSWNSTYATGALAYDGKYRLVGEQDTSTGSAGNESVVYTYDTYADMMANNWSDWSFTLNDWLNGYSTVGLAYDGQYRLMGERDTSSGSGAQSYIYTYDTFQDLLDHNWTSYDATGFSWASDYSTGGLAYDGNGFRLFGETDTTGTGTESIVYHYDTYADMLSNSFSGYDWTSNDWSTGYRTRGFAFHQVPEPSSMAVLGLGAVGLAFRRKRRVKD